MYIYAFFQNTYLFMRMRISISILLLLVAGALFAQQSTIYTEENKDFKKALRLYNKQKYGAAQKIFRDVSSYYGDGEFTVKTESEFFEAACAFYLYHPNTEVLLTAFLNNYPESPRVREAVYLMGLYKYRENDYDEALVWFKKVDKSILVGDDVHEYNFKTGYCYFTVGENDKALVYLSKSKDIENKYQVYALYYCAHIYYLQGNYESALTNFEQLSKNDKFAKIVPYYITQIYFIQKRYDDLIAYAPQYLETATSKRKPEIARMIGEAYYQREKFEEALPYLEIFYQEGTTFTKDDYYTLGYAYYKTGNYEKAGTFFNKVTGENDTIAQNAYYHLADCYVKAGDKKAARTAFGAAMKYDVDKDIKREAHWNYAKITYELSYSPFNEAIEALEEFIETYKNSDKLDEAYTFLMQVYLSTKNYKDALSSIEKIKKKNSDVNKAYQRITYFRGLELFNNLEFQEAREMFKKSLTQSVFDKDIKALCYYWTGEAFYREKDFVSASEYYNTFLLSPGAINKVEYRIAHYNLGYTFFKDEKYQEAISWFRKYTTIEKGKTRLKGDACNRLGDCYFMLKDYNKAIEYYSESMTMDVEDPDYALFQIGFCKGLKIDFDGKITSLTELIRVYPSSSFVDDALYELARTFEAQELPDMAIPNYERILREHPTSSYVKKSLLQLGLIQYNASDYQAALAAYKRVVEEYPASVEARNSLRGMKSVYIEMNDPDGYFDYINSRGGEVNVSLAEQDSVMFLAARDAYMNDKCDVAVPLFKRYIEKFEEGYYILDAHFFKADCEMKSGDFADALRSFEFVISKNKNDYTESSLLVAAEINMKMERYEPALLNFSELEKVAELKSNLLSARIGKMRCLEKLKRHEQAIEAAENLIATDKVSEELVREATLLMAISYENIGQMEKAMSKYRTVALDVKSAEGAKGKYKVCVLLFNQEKYDESEKEILDFLNKTSPYQYWLAKSYMLWGDIFVVREDFFQAKQTYISIVENYANKDDGIVDDAQEKIKTVEQLEFDKNNGEQQDMEIEVFEDKDSKEFFETKTENDTISN